MKLLAECDVVSKTIIAEDIKITHDNKVYEFIKDSKTGFINKIKIVQKIADPTKFYSEITPMNNGPVKVHWNIKTDDELMNVVKEEFFEIGTHLSFSFNFESIDWKYFRHELICETEEEKRNVKISGFNVNKDTELPPVKCNQKALEELIKYKINSKPLLVPISFWLEGAQEFRNEKYINAFFNFYFILEGMFGNGHTKNKLVGKAFNESMRLQDILAREIKRFQNNPSLLKELSDFLSSREKTLNNIDIIKTIINVRGCLHHFTNNSKRLEKAPLNQEKVKPLADLLMGLTIHSIFLKIVDINRARMGLDN